MKPLHSVVAGDLRNHRARRRSDAVLAVIDQLERRVFLSGTEVPLFSLNGADGETLNGVVEDSSGNLFGIAENTYPNGNQNANPGPGVLFEVPVNTSTVNDLYTFSNPNGGDAIPSPASLIIDSSGNLYGTLASGAANTPETVFEFPVGTTTPITIGTFAAQTSGQVTAVDSAGNVYGIEGATAFEIVHNSGVITPLDPNGVVQQNIVDLRLGPDGNLYGVTAGGNTLAGPNPELFEIAPSNDNVQVLASFNPATSGYDPVGLTFDSSGNIWGFCQNGGPDNPSDTYGNGTVWELPLPVTGTTPTINFIAQITSAVGNTVTTLPAFGTSGYLYGMTENGGANGQGTVFELAPGATTVTDGYDFAAGEENPDLPEGSITNSSGFVPDTVPTTTASPAAEVVLAGHQITPAGNGSESVTRYWSYWTNRNPETGKTETTFGSRGTEIVFGPIVGPPTPEQVNARKQSDRQRQDDEKDQQESFGSHLLQSLAISQFGQVSSEGLHIGALADTEAGTEASLSSELTPITQMLAEATKKLAASGPLISKYTAAYNHYTREGTTVTALTAQLAAQNNAAKQAAIQKKITADEAVQATLLTQEDTDYTATDNELDDLETLETNIATALAALPSPFAELTGGITSVPALINPGKKGTAVLTVTNSGNVPVTMSFQMVLSARPQGTTGSADVTLGTDTIKLHLLKPNVPTPEHLSFLIPKTLPAGTYSLVATPVISSTLTGTATPVVSTTTFIVP
jgi:uncharacterized repeat protein (TIGR03803 family)